VYDTWTGATGGPFDFGATGEQYSYLLANIPCLTGDLIEASVNKHLRWHNDDNWYIGAELTVWAADGFYGFPGTMYPSGGKCIIKESHYPATMTGGYSTRCVHVEGVVQVPTAQNYWVGLRVFGFPEVAGDVVYNVTGNDSAVAKVLRVPS
jgi:hypothetical protein